VLPMTDKWLKIVNSPEAAALLKLVRHIHLLCDHEGDVSEFLPKLLHQLAQLLDVQTAAVTVHHSGSKQQILARYNRGRSAITDETLLAIAEKVSSDKRKIASWPDGDVLRNVLASPISKSNKILGSLILANKSNGAFSDYDDVVVTLVESNMDHVIYDWLRRQEHRLIQTENRVIKALDDIRDETGEQAEALDRMIKTVLDSVGAQIGFITLYDSEKDRHLPGGKVMRGARPMSQKDYKLVGNLVRLAREERKSFIKKKIPESELDCVLVVPMFVSGIFLGASVLINKEDNTFFGIQDIQLVESVNRIISNFIFQEEKVKRLSKLIGTEARRDVEEALMGHHPDQSIGQRMEVSMLFADIRGYSSLTRDMDPTTAVRMLNDFFSAVTPIIVSHGGMVDKYVGDEVVALFTQSNPTGTHEQMAVEAALAMQEELRKLNIEWEMTGRPMIHIGIGIHTGEVVLGQIGSYDRKDYTAIGANMNYAARLMSVAGPREVIVSEHTFIGLAGKIAARLVGPFDIKGFGRRQAYLVEGHTPLQF